MTKEQCQVVEAEAKEGVGSLAKSQVLASWCLFVALADSCSRELLFFWCVFS